MLSKIDEEVAEIRQAIALPESIRKERVSEEIGDLLFAVASLARKLEIEPEIALRSALEKFRTRFSALEARVNASGEPFDAFSLEQLEAIWQDVKDRD